MKYENNKVRDLNIAYIGGGSRGWAWTFMTDLSMDDSLSGSVFTISMRLRPKTTKSSEIS